MFKRYFPENNTLGRLSVTSEQNYFFNELNNFHLDYELNETL